jgi:hypothetical protein
MLDRLGVLELHETGARHGMNGIAGGVGDEMKMKLGHAISPGAGVEKRRLIPVILWSTASGTDRSSLALFSKRISSPWDKYNPTVLVSGKSVIGGDSIPSFQLHESRGRTRLSAPYTRFRPLFQAKAARVGIDR